MKASQEQFELALDRGIDDWYVACRRNAGSPATVAEATSETAIDLDLNGFGALDEASRRELAGLVDMLDLVAEFAVSAPAHEAAQAVSASASSIGPITKVAAGGTVDSPPGLGTSAAPDLTLPVSEFRYGSRRSGTRVMLTAVAAVGLLIAGIGIGIAVSGRGSPGSDVPHQPAASGPRLPAELLSQVRSEADFAADPYPAQPVTWVRTTIGRIRAWAPQKWPYSTTVKPMEASTPAWIAYLRGNFYGQPAQKSGIFHLNWYLDVPGKGTFGTSGPAPSWQTDLSPLGTVHYLYLRPPPPQPVLPARIDRYLENWVRINGNVFPSQPALWAETTVGRIRSLTDGRVSIPKSISSGTSAWAVDIQRPVVFGSLQANQWYFTTSRSDYAWFVSPLSGIQRFGPVHEVWLTAGAPTTLSPLADEQVSQALNNQYLGTRYFPTSVSAEWVGTTVSAIERLTAPQVDAFSSVPGPTAVWVIELSLTATPGHSGGPDWLLVTTKNPASTSAEADDSSAGASPLFGITTLSQLGTVHAATFHVSRGGTVTFSP
jgi:hypothetical protein